MPKIYIIEDDEDICNLVIYALSSSFETRGFASPSQFWQQMRQDIRDEQLPSLVLLDIMLPQEDGISILRELKTDRLTRSMPVIMVTAKNSEIDRVKGLDYGADDYVTKPFSVLELISRIKAVLRRSVAYGNASYPQAAGHEDAPVAAVLVAGPISLDSGKHTVEVDGSQIQLTLKEFELLELLVENVGIVLSRERILSQVWDINFEGETRTVDMHIKTLRQKLGAAASAIKTVRGVGYKVEA